MAESAKPPGDGSPPTPERAPTGPAGADFIAQIVKDPANPPDTLLLTGYLGASSDDGYTRVYFNLELSDYVDVPNEAILHTQPADPNAETLGGTLIWIRRDAEVLHGKAGPTRYKAKFFEGRIAQDWLGGAAGGGGLGGMIPQALPSGWGPCLTDFGPRCPTNDPRRCPDTAFDPRCPPPPTSMPQATICPLQQTACSPCPPTQVPQATICPRQQTACSPCPPQTNPTRCRDESLCPPRCQTQLGTHCPTERCPQGMMGGGQALPQDPQMGGWGMGAAGVGGLNLIQTVNVNCPAISAACPAPSLACPPFTQACPVWTRSGVDCPIGASWFICPSRVLFACPTRVRILCTLDPRCLPVTPPPRTPTPTPTPPPPPWGVPWQGQADAIMGAWGFGANADAAGMGVAGAAPEAAQAQPMSAGCLPITNPQNCLQPTQIWPCQQTNFPQCPPTVFDPQCQQTNFPQCPHTVMGPQCWHTFWPPCPPPTNYQPYCPQSAICPVQSAICPVQSAFCPVTPGCPWGGGGFTPVGGGGYIPGMG